MKLIIGNKNYSSWSLRGWLAAKQSGLSFEEITVPMFGKQWDALKSEDGGTQPSHGKVPILWDDEAVVWDSLAILEYLADKVGRDRFWPRIRWRAAWRARWSRKCIPPTMRCAANAR